MLRVLLLAAAAHAACTPAVSLDFFAPAVDAREVHAAQVGLSACVYGSVAARCKMNENMPNNGGERAL